ncbi:MAG: tyrosine-type recombinase/integrase [Chloroflexota bacterium]
MTTLNEAFEKFVLVKEASMRSQETIKWYTSIVMACIEHLGTECSVTNVQEDDMLMYLKALRTRDVRYEDAKQRPTQQGGLSRASIRSHIRALKGFWKWCAKRYDMKDPMSSIQMPKRGQPKVKAISPDEFCKLMDATLDTSAGVRDRAILALLADTGARAGGLLSLKVDTVDIIRCRGEVIEKGYKKRWIYWSYHTSRLLDKWLSVRESNSDSVIVNMKTGDPLTYSGLAQLLKRLKNRSKVRGRVNAHAFRHNFARMYLMGGGDLVTLARLLGHTDVNVTAAYYAVFADDELADLQKKYSPLKRMLDR